MLLFIIGGVILVGVVRVVGVGGGVGGGLFLAGVTKTKSSPREN